jgi:serine protease inhibitor
MANWLERERATCYLPKAEVDQQPEISWVERMNYQGESVPMLIDEALNQNKLSLTEKGAHAQSAAAISVTGSLSIAPPDKIVAINEPFYFWISKDNCPVPVFCAYVDKESWIEVKE